MITFADPWVLLLLVLVPLLGWRAYTRASSGRLRYSSLQPLRQLSAAARRFHPRLLLPLLRLATLVLFIIALTRPQAGNTFSENNSEGVDIMLAMDTSGSMQALDFKIEGQPVNRLAVVKKVVAEFIKKRENDRMGLVVFAAEAFIQCPIT